MKTPIVSTLAVLLGCLCIFESCKKKDGNGECRISMVHITSDQYDATTTLNYDASQRLSQASTTGSASKMRQFSYKSDSIFVTENTGSGSTRYTVTTNNAGHINKLLVYSNTGTVSSITDYTYNSAGQVIAKSITVGNSTPIIYTISYNSTGDAASIYNNANTFSVTSYTYLTDKAYQVADGAGIADFLDYGITMVTNKHLLQSSNVVNATTGVTTITNEYTFDGDRIAKMIQTAQGKATTYDYTYSCD